jgi:hypothetical protein
MPFLSYEQFERRVGESLARTLTKSAQGFESDERWAASLVTQITGTAPPGDPESASDWAQQACADLIYAKRIPKLEAVTAEQVKGAGDLDRQTIEELERRKMSAPSGSQDAHVGDIEGMVTW